MINTTQLLVSIMLILGVQVCDANERVQASSAEITFSNREVSRCGSADFTSERILTDLLRYSRLAEIADLDLSRGTLTVEYVSERSSACSKLRLITDQALEKFEQSRAGIPAERIPPGWPEGFVSEYFKIGSKYFEVVLQTSEEFEENLDPGEPLTQAWPGRTGGVKIFDEKMRQIAVIDLMGEILE